MNTETRDVLIVLGGALLIVLLFNAKGAKAVAAESAGGTGVPATATESDLQKQKDAMIVLNAYKLALGNNESAAGLQELNSITLGKYGMQVSKNRENRLVVMDRTGNKVIEDKS